MNKICYLTGYYTACFFNGLIHVLGKLSVNPKPLKAITLFFLSLALSNLVHLLPQVFYSSVSWFSLTLNRLSIVSWLLHGIVILGSVICLSPIGGVILSSRNADTADVLVFCWVLILALSVGSLSSILL